MPYSLQYVFDKPKGEVLSCMNVSYPDSVFTVAVYLCFVTAQPILYTVTMFV